ncbi:MAG: hypothetical protein K9G39_10840 [Chlorobium sp.]|uniref:hypothetical protein n=1 Tax=Chlorobium sp. TaxID=1095 RepID=UPI0025BA0E60|nr:hypothetical protein [Chlorobium sp.]MCF8384064.1 hypothetical protein [Chlorobium sp.]
MKTLKPFLTAAADQLKHFLGRAGRSFWLPFSAASLVMIFSIFTILSSSPGTYIDELGFTGDDDYVVIEDASEIKKPSIDKKTVQSGQSLYTILTSNGLTPADVDNITKQLKGSFSIRGFRAGQNYEIEKSSTGIFQRFTYFQDRAVTLHIERESTSGDLKVRRDAKEYENRLATIEGSVSETLSSELAQRERSGLMRPVRKLFAGRLNFKRDIKPGSEFRLLFEEKWLDDEFISTGKIIAAEISVNKKNYTAYRYTDAKGKTGYYIVDPDFQTKV